MPNYEYLCKNCGHRFEQIRKFSDRQLRKCPECGGVIEQVISAPAVQFKGSGWYVTDYPKKGAGSASSSSSFFGRRQRHEGNERVQRHERGERLQRHQERRQAQVRYRAQEAQERLMIGRSGDRVIGRSTTEPTSRWSDFRMTRSPDTASALACRLPGFAGGAVRHRRFPPRIAGRVPIARIPDMRRR